MFLKDEYFPGGQISHMSLFVLGPVPNPSQYVQFVDPGGETEKKQSEQYEFSKYERYFPAVQSTHVDFDSV
jgi:hypothetical protein